jgi:hypothetical protein
MKIFDFFINTVYWLWIFIVPSGVLSFLGFWLYQKEPKNFTLSILLSIAGVIFGIYFAEKVRRKYGLSNFFSSIMSSNDISDKSENDK